MPVSAAVPTNPLPICRLDAIDSQENSTPINTRVAEMAHVAATNAAPRWIPPRTHNGRFSRRSRRKNSHTPIPEPSSPTAAVHSSATGSENSRTAKSDADEPTSNEARPVRRTPAADAPTTAAAASRPPGCSTSASTARVCLARIAT